ncbi:MAG: tRNA pseudouridine(38-40) synthase TruA [Planctomycetota bacterium]
MSDEPVQLRYKLTVAYRGTAYHGWQRQMVPGDDTSAAELPTVQNVLRLALQRTVGHPVNVVGASRTDAGVHAEGQAASFETLRHQIAPDRLMAATNAKLPADVAIRSIEPVANDFDVIGDTAEKAYRYTVHNGRQKNVFAGDVMLHLPPMPSPLEVAAMHEAAERFVGEHDFASFAKPGHGRESTVRTVTSAKVSRDGDRVHFEIAGTGFLWHQVRIMTGTLLRVGAGKVTPEAMTTILSARDREAAGPTAPPHGLCLLWVRHRRQVESATVAAAE